VKKYNYHHVNMSLLQKICILLFYVVENMILFQGEGDVIDGFVEVNSGALEMVR
jgi:cytosine/uracil/thiamine/allantoin permease